MRHWSSWPSAQALSPAPTGPRCVRGPLLVGATNGRGSRTSSSRATSVQSGPVPGTSWRVLYILVGCRTCRMNPAPLASFRTRRSPGTCGKCRPGLPGRPGVDLRPCTGERAPGLTRRGDSSPGWPHQLLRGGRVPKRKPGGGTGLPTVLMRRVALGVPGAECAAWLAIVQLRLKKEVPIMRSSHGTRPAS